MKGKSNSKNSELELEREQLEEKNDLNQRGDDVVAFRKSCEVTGTGLSHYILVDDKIKK